ncbi:hypothetical protein BU26DRAFT_504125 [Trematosphaeria pertusa]|uniref:Uncharacterized protein n=1 Tax=Trematosphaeria pertusa TaxID=390896 RepID=A0A6A6IJC2_9PLEO|nr:uncharacterized protein BU26DRAFT_504125 [Trematosphaeria pertusa]KAF2249670.1 hypothetical protein BU26DRAFT_504125 [Trematosphaeria pertusa]
MSVADVYTGVWINHAKGLILGPTLTLSDFHGTLFIAFLALFINFFGNQMWVILSYALFHIRSRRTEQDGLYHQLQATLRNSVSSLSDSWKFTLIAWHWRGKSHRVLRRVLPLLALSSLHCLKVGLASIYATPIIQLQPDVLSRGAICGDWNSTALESDYDVVYKYTEEQIHLWEKSGSYARLCYPSDLREDTGSAATCVQRGETRKVWRNSTEERCPFAVHMCKDDHVYALDTGLLDSNLDLGINSPKEDRIQYRRKMTCSPLTTEGFVEGPLEAGSRSNLTTPNPWMNISIWNYNYGKLTYANEDNFTNATWVYDDGLLRPSYSRDTDSTFKLYVSTYFPNETRSASKWGYWDRSWDFSTFDAIPELRADGVTNVLFLVTAVCYPNPVDDPWFSSHDKIDEGPNGGSFYCLDGYPKVSPLGCLEQHEFCNPENGECSNLTSTHKPPDYRALGLNARQMRVAERVFKATTGLSISGVIRFLGAEKTLHARTSAINGLPPNQWQLELDNWFGIVMAQMQSVLLQWATGPEKPENRRYIIPPTDPDVAWMCNNQVVHDSRYICFSVLGISLFIGTGSLVVLVGWFIDDIVRAVQRPLGKGAYRRFEWRWNEMFQLQRTAFALQGAGLWVESKAPVPVTKEMEKWTIPGALDGKIERKSGI